MALHVIVGAGPIGTGVARLLAERGERVRVISRRGSGPDHPAVERVRADATQADRLSELATGAAALYNCANPEYHRWLTDWPPLAAALLTAAERNGAVLARSSVSYVRPGGAGADPGAAAHVFPAGRRLNSLSARTSMHPRRAGGIFDATRIASFTSLASMR
jgi:uncharacterized protein YbjT (DUF2867 family)